MKELFNGIDYRDLHFHALHYLCPARRDIVDGSQTDSMQLLRQILGVFPENHNAENVTSTLILASDGTSVAWFCLKK